MPLTGVLLLLALGEAREENLSRAARYVGILRDLVRTLEISVSHGRLNEVVIERA